MEVDVAIWTKWMREKGKGDRERKREMEDRKRERERKSLSALSGRPTEGPH